MCESVSCCFVYNNQISSIPCLAMALGTGTPWAVDGTHCVYRSSCVPLQIKRGFSGFAIWV